MSVCSVICPALTQQSHRTLKSRQYNYEAAFVEIADIIDRASVCVGPRDGMLEMLADNGA